MSGVTNKSLCSFINNFSKIVYIILITMNPKEVWVVSQRRSSCRLRSTHAAAPLSSSGNTNKRFPIMFPTVSYVDWGQSHKCSEIWSVVKLSSYGPDSWFFGKGILQGLNNTFSCASKVFSKLILKFVKRSVLFSTSRFFRVSFIFHDNSVFGKGSVWWMALYRNKQCVRSNVLEFQKYKAWIDLSTTDVWKKSVGKSAIKKTAVQRRIVIIVWLNILKRIEN